MANEQNLQHVQPGQVLNPNGRPKGSVNRKTILNWLLFEADLENMGVVSDRSKLPAWWDKVKPKTMYEAMTMAMAVKAMSGEEKAFNALNRALGLDINAGGQLNVVHIFKPEKLSPDDFNAAGADLLRHTHNVVEGETVDERVESTAGTTDLSLTNP